MHHRNTVRLVRKVFLVALFLSFYFMTPSAFTGSLRADNTLVKVYGRVADAKTHQPIPNVSLIFFAFPPPGEYFIARTNASGIYEMNVTGGKDYGVFASSDYWPSTLGINYVPASRRISVANEPLNVSFTLLPGASIYIVGIFYPPTLDPAPIRWRQRFYVVDEFRLLDKTDAIREFTVSADGTTAAQSPYGLGKVVNGILVPADMPVKVRGEIEYQNGSIVYLTIDREGDYLNLTQGSLTFINLHALWLSKHPDYVTTRLQRVQGMVDKAEEKGFHVSYEKSRVSRAENLISTAYAKKAEGDHDAAYADLYEALLILKDVEEGFQGFYLNAAQSVFLITPLLAFTAVALASVIFENWRRRLAASLILHIALFGLLYILYPGYSALQGVYNPLASTPFEALLLPLLVMSSLCEASFLVLGVPRLVRERASMEELRLMSAIAAAFSVAARNLKRRKLRTLLTSSLMLISIFAFIALTSLSFEEGFIIQPKSSQAPSEGFLLRNPADPYPSKSVDPAVLHWLKARPETALLAPKLENWPSTGIDGPPPPLTAIQAPKSGLTFDIYGVLGVYPSLEANITRMDTIITEGQFLKDGDPRGILISQEAAQKLQVGINDTVVLYGQTFNVTGIFDGGKLEGLKDLDGESLVPWKLAITHPPVGEPVYSASRVRGMEVVIVHGETAERLPQMMISRVDVQTKSPEEIMALARLVVLYWPNFRAFASTATGINSLFIGSYFVIMGFTEATVPLALVILNMGVMMLSAVYERRREVFTMSSVGLNPSHITAVFVAEALVIGIIAGSLGYILGLISYRFLGIFPTAIGVKQKVEAVWGILAISLSIAAAVLGTAIPALKASLIATPSLLRKWRIKVEEKPKKAGEPWILKMPLRVRKEDLENFFGFMEKRLHGYALYSYVWIENVKVFKAAEPTATRLSFSYVFSEENIATENELFLVKDLLPNRYTVTLSSKTRRGTITSRDEADVRQTASFIRSLILQYTTSEWRSREG